MIDAKRYLRLQDKGLTKIVKKEDGNYLQFARFDVEFGTPVDPEEQKINVDEINIRKKEISDELTGIELLLKEIQS
jgi:hypothetical protein